MNINFNFNLISTIRLLIIALSVFLNTHSQLVFAQDNLLDPNFGRQGKQLSTGGKEENIPIFIHRLSDGKILFGTIARYGKISKLTLVRLESTGKVDSSFATNGILLSDNKPSYYYGKSIVLDSSENIYIGGGDPIATSNFRITKFSREGIPDLLFGNLGHVDFALTYKNARTQIKLRNNHIYLLGNLNSKNGYPYEIQKFDLDGNQVYSLGQNGVITLPTNLASPELELTADDKLIVIGEVNYKLIIRKYLQNGNPDLSFGLNGETYHNDTILRKQAELVYILKDQSILISGSAVNSNRFKFLEKYSKEGVMDTTFAKEGILRITDTTAQYPFNLYVFQDEQEITTVHGERNGHENFISIKKFTLNGEINTAFGINGSLRLEYVGLSSQNYGDAFQDKNGNILLANRLYTFSNPGFSQISFLNPDGTLNNSFGDQGYRDLWFGFYAVYSSGLITLNNKSFIQGGTQYYGWGSNIQLNKFNSNGIPDSSWSVNGVYTPTRQRVFFNNWCGAIQHDGKILVGGSASVDTITDQNDQMYICRIHTNGQLDSSFGDAGVKHISDRHHSYLSAYTILTEPDGNILAGGITSYSFPSIFRLNESGSIVTVFEIVKGTWSRAIYKILRTANDKIYTIGIGYNLNDKIYYPHLTRYFSDGKLDLTFGDSATVLISTATRNIILSGILDQQERIILVGYDTIIGPEYSMFACRFLPDGKIDSTFADKGYFRYKVNDRNSAFMDVLIDQQDRIFIGGIGYKTNTTDFILLCLNENGELINNFGEAGVVYADFYGGEDYLTSMIFDSDENIILGGDSETAESYYMALAKVLNNLNVGTIDGATTSELHFIYPNPVTDRATLKFALNKKANVTISITDLKGNKIHTLVTQNDYNAGEHQVELKLPYGLASGYFFVTIDTGVQNRSVRFLKM